MVGSSFFESAQVITARVYPPNGLDSWFVISPPATAEYLVVDWLLSGDSSGAFSNAGLTDDSTDKTPQQGHQRGKPAA